MTMDIFGARDGDKDILFEAHLFFFCLSVSQFARHVQSSSLARAYLIVLACGKNKFKT